MLDFEGAAVGDFALAPSGFSENIFAIVAGNDGLGVTEHNTGLVAASAFDVHEIRVRGWDQSLELV